MKKKYLLILTVVLGLLGCQKKKYSSIDFEGAWKIDSTYTFYNGFDHKQVISTGNWPMYVYENGMVKEVKSGSFRSFLYSVKADTLIMRPAQGGEESHFSILKLNKDQMNLRKTKLPLFEGDGQNRYEIRYFSRTEMPTDNLIPFRDPRAMGLK